MAQQIDVRGPRFGAVITTVILALVLITAPSPFSTVLLAWQTLAFALGAFAGLKRQPYGVLFRKVVAPRLAPASRFEDPQPPTFAQLVGFAFAAVGLAGALTGADVVAEVAVGLALAAAFLNAAFAICLGCEMYTLGKRLLAH